MMKLFGQGRKQDGSCDAKTPRWNGLNLPQLFSSGNEEVVKTKCAGGSRSTVLLRILQRITCTMLNDLSPSTWTSHYAKHFE